MTPNQSFNINNTMPLLILKHFFIILLEYFKANICFRATDALCLSFLELSQSYYEINHRHVSGRMELVSGSKDFEHYITVLCEIHDFTHFPIKYLHGEIVRALFTFTDVY